MIAQSRSGKVRLFKTQNGYILAQLMSRGYWVYTETQSDCPELCDRHPAERVYIEDCTPFEIPQGLCSWRMVDQSRIDAQAELENRRQLAHQAAMAKDAALDAELAAHGGDPLWWMK